MISVEIRAYLITKMKEKYPKADAEDIDVAIKGFEEYVELVKQYGEVPMFSKSVDDVWHFFILNTRVYAEWCGEELNFFLHHTPTNPASVDVNEGRKALGLLWMRACKECHIDPFKFPGRRETPNLFLADVKLLDEYIDPYDIYEQVKADRDEAIKASKSLGRFFRAKDQTKYGQALREDYPSKTVEDSFTAAIMASAAASDTPSYSSHTKSEPSTHNSSRNDDTSHHSTHSSHTTHHSCGSSSHSSHSCSSSSHSCSSSSCGSSSSCSS